MLTDSKDATQAQPPVASAGDSRPAAAAAPSNSAATDSKAKPPVVWLLFDIDNTVTDVKTGQWNGGVESWQQLCRELIAFAKTQNVTLKIGVVSARLRADKVLAEVINGLKEFLYCEDEDKNRTALYDEKAGQYKIKHLVDTYKIASANHAATKQKFANGLIPVFLTRYFVEETIKEAVADVLCFEFGDAILEKENNIFEVKKSFCLDAIRVWEGIAHEFLIMVDDAPQVHNDLKAEKYDNVISAAECVANPQKVIAEIKRVTELVIHDAAQNKPSVRAVMDKPAVVVADPHGVEGYQTTIINNIACLSVSLDELAGSAAIAVAAAAAQQNAALAATATPTLHH